MHNPFRDTVQKISDLGVWVQRLVLLLAGALLALAFAPYDVAPVIFISLPIVFVFIDQSKTRTEAFHLGWWFGFGLMMAGLNWVGHSFTQQEAFPVFLAPFAVLALTAVLALYYGLMGMIYHWCKSRSRWQGIFSYLLFAALWILLEAARSYLLTGFPWHLIASIWADWLALAQSVYYLSMFGAGFITVLVALIPVMIVDGLYSPAAKRASLMGCVLVVSLIFAGLSYAGSMRLSANPTSYHSDVPVRLVQGNINQREKWNDLLMADHFDKYLLLSRQQSQRGKAEGKRLLIWPETAVQDETFDRESSLERYRMAMLLENRSYGLTGVPRVDVKGGRVRYFNSMMAIDQSRRLFARYDKSHLVPFGEYLPLQGLLNAIGLQSLTGGYFTAGAGPKTIKLPDIPAFSPLICYEIIFPGFATNTSNAERPEWLLNITNDAWFGASAGPEQHLALVRMRAIEEGLPVLRAANTGVTAAIDPLGRVIEKLQVEVAGVLDIDLPQAMPESKLNSWAKILLSLLILLAIPVTTLIWGNRK